MKGPDMAHTINVGDTKDAILRAINEKVDADDLLEADLLDDALTILNRIEATHITIVVGSK